MWTLRLLGQAAARSLTTPSAGVIISRAPGLINRTQRALQQQNPGFFTQGRGIAARASSQVSLPGVTDVQGVLPHLDVDRKEYFDIPSTIVSKGIDLLTSNNVDVPARLLLRDLPWETLLSNPSVKSNPVLFAQISAQREQLETWERCGRTVAPALAKSIMEKVGGWMGLMELSATLEATKSAKEAINEVLKHSQQTTWNDMEKKLAIIQDYIEREEWTIAKQLAERGVKACDRLYQSLEAASQNLRQVNEDNRAIVNTCITAGMGGLVIAGITSAYLGIVENVSALAEGVLGTLQRAAATGAVALFGISAYKWIHSEDARNYLARMDAARMMRVSMRNRFDEMLDKVVFANPALLATDRKSVV